MKFKTRILLKFISNEKQRKWRPFYGPPFLLINKREKYEKMFLTKVLFTLMSLLYMKCVNNLCTKTKGNLTIP